MIRTERGFTLIELLVVISIVGMLSTVILASLNTARSKSVIAAALQFEGYTIRSKGDRAVVWWKFNENGSATSYDSTGLGNTGTLSGSLMSYVSTNLVNPAKAFALSFNGTDNYVITQLPAAQSALSSKGFTFMAWIKPSAGGGAAETIMSRYVTDFKRDTAGVLSFRVWTGAPGHILTGGVAKDNEWTHVAAVYDADNISRIYVNGKLAATSPVNPLAVSDLMTTPSFIVGAGEFPVGTRLNYFLGQIDDAVFINEGVSMAQIEKQYAEGKRDHLTLR